MKLFKPLIMLIFPLLYTVLSINLSGSQQIIAADKHSGNKDLINNKEVIMCYRSAAIPPKANTIESIKKDLESNEKLYKEGTINQQTYETRKKDLSEQLKSIEKNNK
ncbi:MAG: hypothetical protein AB1782_09405 [Cyanobacteriota bacterium]